MKTSNLEKELAFARSKVNQFKFGTQEWENAMTIVRHLTERIDSAKPKQEFCSIDSGVHRTRLLNGKLV